MRVLFIAKKKQQIWSNDDYSNGPSSGLTNSARFVCAMLKKHGIEAKLVTVVDNNCVDREVTEFRPDVVIIEAIWILPSKFKILNKLHPAVSWVIRNHSQLPFLSNEGSALDWLLSYIEYDNVYVSSNNNRATHEIQELFAHKFHHMTAHEIMARTPLLLNYYPIPKHDHTKIFADKEVVDVGCFGAIRPLKNQLNQAIAAIKFAKQIDKKLHFHINSTRVEGNGGPILSNLRRLFQHIPGATLIEHQWMTHEKFLELIHQMDIGLQVSFSESFNIVAADFAAHHIPIVVSKEIDWADDIYKADPCDVNDIVDKMMRVKSHADSAHHRELHLNGLKNYDRKSEIVWLDFLKSLDS